MSEAPRQPDFSDLDGRLLQLLVAVVEEGSVTRAAQRLGVTQSAVSHLLDKLRAIVGDPLVVRSGRSIVATARAQQLTQRARALLDELRSFAATARFDPASVDAWVTIAANDFQRDLLLPTFVQRIRRQAPGLRLRVIPSGVPRPEMLRDDHCQLIVTPRPPEGSDILQKRLFEDHYRVFFDAGCRAAPASTEAYLQAGHVTVLYEARRPLEVDQALAAHGVRRRFEVFVPGFAGVPSFVKGTPLLATMPGLLRAGLLRGLASCEAPVPCPSLPMYLVWHRRLHQDPMYRWLRDELVLTVPVALAQASLPAAAGH